jgi:hypothetical protein
MTACNGEWRVLRQQDVAAHSPLRQLYVSSPALFLDRSQHFCSDCQNKKLRGSEPSHEARSADEA